MFPVLYSFNGVGETVYVGRDKKKCGVSLPVDAQGVSRVHGSFKWTSQNELNFCDSSTYGTLVDGVLVKGGTKVLHDQTRIVVGDVELVIVFSKNEPVSISSSSDSLGISKQGSTVKRKNVTVGLENDNKRSKLSVKTTNRAGAHQSQISSFFGKKPLLVDDDCMVIADDTPQSQGFESEPTTGNRTVSFVADTAELQNGTGWKPDSIPAKISQLAPSTGVRRKKQCIFAENRLPTSSRKTMILAEDTQPKTSLLKGAIYGAGDRSNVTMSVPETFKQSISGPVSAFNSTKILAEDTDPRVRMEDRFTRGDRSVGNVTTIITDSCHQRGMVSTTTIPEKVDVDDDDVTVLASSTLPKRTGSNTSATKRKSASEKKTSIFDSRPAKKRPTFPTVDENFSDDEVDVRIEEPEAESTVRCTSSFAQKISASPIRSTCATSEVIPRKSARGAVKKSIFSQMPPKKQQQGTLDKVDERFPGEDTGPPMELPDVKDILKLVSTGKRYDVRAEEDEDEDDQGVEIERVVAKLNNLVHYADIERPPRPRPAPQLDVSSGSNSANFKRFRKASQGRFNASLSSAKRPCVIGGSDDLVDFRQLPHGA
ncbi:hypothetical protein Q1695_011644 [Nippostrongylus brasiliensis]|nr:hypothetical protein Q1695_011644 [Nippostrongylus brasiliensis]